MKRGTWLSAFGLAAIIGLGASNLTAASIIDDWSNVKAPPAPVLKPVTVDPKTTALLMIDFVTQACNPERSPPRCVSSLAAVKKLLDEARAAGVMVVYTAYGKNTEKDIVPEVAPNGSEPFVVAFLDKYLGTDLQKILKDKGIQTVVIVGHAAHGAVITTASESAERGFTVVLPVDGVSAESLYAEQYTAWDLVNAPIISSKVTLTTIDMMKF